MKNLLVKCISVCFACAASLAFAIPTIDQPAPNFTAMSADGKMVNLNDYKGKTVILEWTNAQCPFVKKHYSGGNMQALQAKYTKDDVVWLSVISSAEGKQGYVTPAEANKLSSSRNASPTEIILDAEGSVGKLYGAKTTPHMYVIDPEGTLRYMGAIDSVRSANSADIADATNYVDAAMLALASGTAVSKPVTQAYGCTVKY